MGYLCHVIYTRTKKFLCDKFVKGITLISVAKIVNAPLHKKTKQKDEKQQPKIILEMTSHIANGKRSF